jgi:Domain of unknown function (DUF4178)
MSSNTAYKCPSCNGSLEIKNRFSKVVICPYCMQTCEISDSGLDPTGLAPKLADFKSILAIGKSGKIKNTPFKTLGRLRYKYDGGFWDEWFVELENSMGSSNKRAWLQEDEGEFTLFEQQQIASEIPLFEEISVGRKFSINSLEIFVVEKVEALIAGGAGEIPFRINPGMIVYCIDGNTNGNLVSIEFTPDEISFSTGTTVDIEEIEVN